MGGFPPPVENLFIPPPRKILPSRLPPPSFYPPPPKGWNHQKHSSLGFFHVVKKSPSGGIFTPPLTAIWKTLYWGDDTPLQTMDDPLKQWPTGRKRGEEGNTKN